MLGSSPVSIATSFTSKLLNEISLSVSRDKAISFVPMYECKLFDRRCFALVPGINTCVNIERSYAYRQLLSSLSLPTHMCDLLCFVDLETLNDA